MKYLVTEKIMASEDDGVRTRKCAHLRELEQSYHNLRNKFPMGLRALDDENDEKAKRLKEKIDKLRGELFPDEKVIKADLANMGVTPEGRPANEGGAGGGVGQFGDSGSAVHPEYEAKPLEEVAPGVAVPDKPFEIREALMKKPSNYDTARKVPNPYPAVKPGTDSIDYPTVSALLSPYPAVDLVLADEEPEAEPSGEADAGIVEDKDHYEQLGITDPSEFGVKFKGQLDIMAEEHDLGDLLGYALTDYGIIIFGSENVLKLDYALEDPDVKPVYYFEHEEEPEVEDLPAPEEEPALPVVVEEPEAE